MIPVDRRWGVLSGGMSPEREISLSSGRHIAARMREFGYRVDAIVLDDAPVATLVAARVDGFVLAMHGGWGEDGRLQAVLDLLGMPYSGSGARASMLAMDKTLAKLAFRAAGVPTPDGIAVSDVSELRSVGRALPPPWVIKPSTGGSSIGVRFVDGSDADASEVEAALAVHGPLLVEAYVPGSILTVPVLDLPSAFRVLDPLEIRPTDALLYDERTKAHGLREYRRPSLGDAERRRVRDAAAAAHRALGCRGITRVDCIWSPDRDATVLEVNTLPGLEPSGNLIQACAAAGIDERGLVAMLIESVRMPDPTADGTPI